MQLKKFAPALIAGLLSSASALADWQLTQPSEVTFVTGKNSHLLEVHRFGRLSGEVSDSGLAKVEIDLTSIDSRIPIRDQRMRDLLFEVSSFAKATIEAQLPAELLAELKAGKVQQIELPAKLNLHGSDEELNLKLLAVPAKDGQLVVTSLRPVLIHANDFAMTKGIRLLQDIAKLKVIAEVVPVNLTLTFKAQ